MEGEGASAPFVFLGAAGLAPVIPCMKAGSPLQRHSAVAAASQAAFSVA